MFQFELTVYPQKLGEFQIKKTDDESQTFETILSNK